MKGRHIRGGALGAFIFLASFAGASDALAQQAGIMLGAMAPDATVETLDGRSTRLSEVIGGRPAVLEFWATWCPLCKALEPAMEAARSRHKDIAFVSIGVPQNQTPAVQRAYVEEHSKRLEGFGVTGIRARVFDVNEPLTAVNRGPLQAA